MDIFNPPGGMCFELTRRAKSEALRTPDTVRGARDAGLGAWGRDSAGARIARTSHLQADLKTVNGCVKNSLEMLEKLLTT